MFKNIIREDRIVVDLARGQFNFLNEKGRPPRAFWAAATIHYLAHNERG